VGAAGRVCSGLIASAFESRVETGGKTGRLPARICDRQGKKSRSPGGRNATFCALKERGRKRDLALSRIQ